MAVGGVQGKCQGRAGAVLLFFELFVQQADEINEVSSGLRQLLPFFLITQTFKIEVYALVTFQMRKTSSNKTGQGFSRRPGVRNVRLHCPIADYS